MVQGGSFRSGFISAGVTKGFTNIELSAEGGNVVGGTITSALIGGTASALSGGKFANGASTAAFQFLFNAFTTAKKLADSNLSAEQYVQQEITMLARMMYAEGEGYDGFVAVGWVVQNRLDDWHFNAYRSTEDYESLINKGGAFYSVDNNEPKWVNSATPENLSASERASFNEAFRAATDVYYGRVADPTGGATFFLSARAPHNDPNYRVTKDNIGGNRFFNYIKW